MSPRDRISAMRGRRGGSAAVVLAALAAGVVQAQTFRHEAPIRVDRPAPFVRLVVPASVLAQSLAPNHADLRIVDAASERVPFAVLPPERSERADERARPATLYPLPARPAADGSWPLPVAIDIVGERISVRRGGAAPTTTARVAGSAGWLVDTGERDAERPRPESLRLAWSGPAEFQAAYRLETSDDLRRWSDAGSGQLLALQSPAGPLTQPLVPLPPAAGRFVRLVWLDPRGATPVVTGAASLAPTRTAASLAPTADVVAAALAAPGTDMLAGLAGDGASRVLVYDLGGVMPVRALQLRFASGGTRLVPVRIDARAATGEPWRALGGTVFRRLEREPSDSSAFDLATAAAPTVPIRQLRLVVDPRVPMPSPGDASLVARIALPELVFAPTGQAPYRLLVGSAERTPGALAVDTLVPRLVDERPRFGSASVGDLRENETVARDADRAARLAALRPWLLWSVLLAGVAALAFMVWRLAASRPPADAA